MATKPPIKTIWGSTAMTSPDMAEPTYLSTGFPAPAGVPVKPPRGFVNWLFNYVMNGVLYLARRGISDWDALETYVVGDKVIDTDLRTYEMIATVAAGTAPQLDPTHWSRVVRE